MSILPLSRDHPSIFNAPVLRHVDTRIFTVRYFMHCMDCTFCNDQCCSYGVDIDEGNVAALRKLGSEFRSYVGLPDSEWFTDEILNDPEFPSGHYRRTRTNGTHCVFHESEGRGCKIHGWCIENGLDYHHYKPLVSILFPLTFNFGILEPSFEAIDGSLVCSAGGPTLYEGGRSELKYFFGDALIAELDSIRDGSI
jgi:hypothetical protein